MRLALWLGATIILTVASILVLTIDPPNDRNDTLASGEALFRANGCSGCHSAEGVTSPVNIGPNLVDLAARAGSRVDGFDARGYVRQSLRAPQAYVVPGFEGGFMPTLELSNEEIEALADFLLDP